MPIPEHIHRFWKALDERLGHTEQTWWGAVVTDARSPAIWDINYARVDEAAPDLTLREVANVLLPALAEVGTDTFHVVCFHPEETTDLLVELSALGHALSWDMVMDLVGEPTVGPTDVRVEPLDAGGELWSRVEESLALFGNDPTVAEQLRAIEETAFATGHKRWLGVRDDEGAIVALAALVLLEGVGYLDNVATFPQARGRGLASSIVTRAIDLAHEAGADHVSLFADPDDVAVVRMYERLGFRKVGRLASTRGPVADVLPREGG
ncbi:MAG: GNAT family N-acetyltransferase [Actinomycetota bacterium]